VTEAPKVTVVGGGLAGITVALRLAQRGCDVKLYEQKRMLGGNLASRETPSGAELDIYPHMFLSWYHNFWRLMQDAGINRSDAFLPMTSVRQLQKGQYPRFTGLTDGYSPRYMVQNLFSGVAPPADMFVFWYATIDLLAERFNPTMLLDNVSVTGFLQARPYMTERAVQGCDSFITMVWAIPAYLASAEDYRSYLAYSVSSYKPPYLLAKGPAGQEVIAPLITALQNARVEIHPETQITSVKCVNKHVTQIHLQDVGFDRDSYQWLGTGNEWDEDVENLVLAVPPYILSDLVRSGGPGESVVDAEPKLAELARLRSQRIPIVHVYFNRTLPPIPAEPVGLHKSELALAFTDISKTWTGVPGFANRTVLSVSASNPYALPGTGENEDAFAIIKELREYLEFDLGERWGESADIDWELTQYEANADSQLFINETGIDVWRPAASCKHIPNLFFAGNFCVNRIGMMTVESAVASGLEAVNAVIKQLNLGGPVEIIEPAASFDALCAWLRYAWAPYALAAKSWSKGTDKLNALVRCLTPRAGPPPSDGTAGAPGPQGPGAAPGAC
jgi:Flavin containing amine oxidoreductase